MQTFLPEISFRASAAALDNKRLGKQRVETLQILNALRGKSKGWVNHPATRMWCGYEPALEQYLRACILEWVSRGFKNTMVIPDENLAVEYPPWIGREDFHRSHQSNLLRKDKDYYGRFNWSVSDDLPYVWPV